MVAAELIHGILEKIGVNPGRFTMDWASAAEATRFVELITSFTRKIQEMGPLGQAEGKDRDDLGLKLRAARSATEAMKLRAGLGNLTKEFREEGDYAPDVLRKKVDKKLGPSIRSEVSSQEILLRLDRRGPTTLEQLAREIGLSGEETAEHLGKFSKKGLVVEKEGVWSLVVGG